MKKSAVCFLIISFINYLACTTLNVASKESIKGNIKDDTLRSDIYVITTDNDRYHFGSWGYRIENDTLYGKGLKINPDNKEPFEGRIAIDDISHFEVEQEDAMATIGLILGIAAFVVVVGYMVIINSIISDISPND